MNLENILVCSPGACSHPIIPSCFIICDVCAEPHCAADAGEERDGGPIGDRARGGSPMAPILNRGGVRTHGLCASGDFIQDSIPVTCVEYARFDFRDFLHPVELAHCQVEASSMLCLESPPPSPGPNAISRFHPAASFPVYQNGNGTYRRVWGSRYGPRPPQVPAVTVHRIG